ncbi:MAG: Rpn family recombination-promoting nuclease/putative transposase [Planctomycetes bacterium]|nr:Rpn family recombination-promoting nuclease/putative transposase [Planctomycetota bacterium]
MGMLEAPHDALFRAVFRHAVHAASWLRSLLPAPVGAVIAWRTLAPAPAAAHGMHLRRQEADLVFTARLAGACDLVLVVEHKHDADADLHGQLLRYVVHLRRAFARRGRGVPPLVVPVVLHHGTAPLPAPAPHPHLAALPAAAASALAALQPQLAFVGDDLAAEPEREPWRPALTPFAQLGLLCLHGLPRRLPDQVLAAFDRWQDLLRAVDRSDDPPGGRDAIEAIGWYALAASEVPAADLSEAFARILRRPEDTIMSTLERTYQKGKAEGRNEGRNEGHEKGRTEGRTEGRADALLRQIGRRFGPPADDVVARVRTASLADLDRWTDRILDARTLAELLAD